MDSVRYTFLSRVNSVSRTEHMEEGFFHWLPRGFRVHVFEFCTTSHAYIYVVETVYQ